MKRVFTNIVMNALYQVFLILVPIITLPYVARVLGPDNLGVNTSVTSLSLFLGYIILMGIAQLGPKEISQALPHERYIIFKKLWHIQLVMGVFVISGYLILSVFVKNTFFLWTQVPFLLSVILDISWFYIGIEQIKKIVIRNTCVKIVSLLLIFLLIKTKDDLWKYLLINSSSLLLANMLFWRELKKIFDNYPAKKIPLKMSKIYISSALILLIPQLSVQFYTSFSNVLVGVLTTSTQLSYYDQSQKIARIVLAIITSISVVLMPVVAKLDKDGNNTAKVEQLLKYSLDYTFIVAALLTAIISVNSDLFVPLFLGKEFVSMIPNMVWASLIIIPISYGGVFANQFALAKGMYRHYSIPFIAGALANPVLNLILTTRFQSFGATISLLVTECLVCFLRILLIRKEINLKKMSKDHFKIIICFFSVWSIGSFFRIQLESSIAMIFVNSIVLTIIFSILLFITNTRIKSDFLSILKFLKNKK